MCLLCSYFQGGRGSTSQSFMQEGSSLRSKPLTLLYTIMTEKVPRSLSIEKRYPSFTSYNENNEQMYWRKSSIKYYSNKVHLFEIF